MVNDAYAAKDVTQSVFVVLAQNARQLTARPALAGWLHNEELLEVNGATTRDYNTATASISI